MVNDADARNELVLLSIQKAEEDMILLEKIVGDDDISPEIVGFHAQQAIEKLLKALLISKIIPFRRTHNLGELLDVFSENGIEVPDTLYDIDDLTPFAVEYRYDALIPTNNEAFSRKGALESVKAVHKWILLQINSAL